MAGYYTLDIADIMKQRKNNEKQPFPHQKDAFAALSKTLPTPIEGYKGTLLVLPTGGGKTFTSVNWICRNILSKGIKVLWLAQSSYLIDQAADTFIKEIHTATERDFINLRVVSSSTSHSNAGSIAITDDVLICTTQTAISAYKPEPLDGRGNTVHTPFKNFIMNCKDTELFVVIDEAHHTPAYGCRTLLLSMREEIKNLYVLGLTATPMHMDKRISGWLKHIYDQWICFEADKNLLQANKVLSVPKYIQKDTGMEFEVDDGLFDRLANKHKDLPDSIIENLANNQSRNNFIISDYINNKSEYGKTLIFADRWPQCEYLVEKLNQQGVKANAVYSVVTGQDSVYSGGSGRRDNKMNEEIIQDFRNGKYDVVVNVKMLTEGVDVPDVKTVMITRQTTSNILMTQMIGRALRGEKAGGGKNKSEANIVFFHDTWKRLLPWADVQGGLEEGRPATQGRNPMSLISIQLIKLATEDIEYAGFEDAAFLTFIPVGFFNCEYTIAIKEGSADELISFEENIVAYEFNVDKYDKMIAALSSQDLSAYEDESVTEDQIEKKANALAAQFFGLEKDNFDGLLIGNITKIIHHVAQNNTPPLFIDFHERDIYDMDKLANEYSYSSQQKINYDLRNIFNDSGKHWGFFYKNYSNFKDAFDKAMNRLFNKANGDIVIMPDDVSDDELTDEVKKQIFIRDHYKCLCCGKNQRKGVSLNADHINPVSMGGKNSVSNLQTLCRYCNTIKAVNEIDYRSKITPLGKPKVRMLPFNAVNSDSIENTITRVVNEFYHCGAMCKLNAHERKNGNFYLTWEIILYAGNNPEWLMEYKKDILKYINIELGWTHVKDISIRN